MVPDERKIENIKSNNKTDDILNKSFNSKQLINFKQKFISPMLSKLNSEEKNSYLDIMLDELSLYKYKKSENISRNLKNANFPLSKNLIYNYLEKYLLEVTYITDKEKRKEHIKYILNTVISDEENECPKCGGRLVERNGKNGSFLGCINYPKCKYTRNIK